MNLRTLLQTGPNNANELFTRLAETSDGAVKTREKLFTELKAELELHIKVEEQHLFPVLRRNAEKELVAEAIKDNRELRAKLDELDGIPKNAETFLEKLKELQKSFRQHARDEKTEILTAVQRALSEEQVQTVTEKMETARVEAEQARQDEVEERRSRLRQEREQTEQQAQEAEAAERGQRETERAVRETGRQMAEVVTKPAVIAAEAMGRTARVVTNAVHEQTERQPATRVAVSPLAEMFLWPWMGALPGRSQPQDQSMAAARPATGAEEVIPLGEEVLEIGKRTVNRGTARIHRYVVETQVEEQVTLQSERVVVERRRPAGETPTGEMLTEVTVEVTETSEVPVIGKRLRLREEVVVRTERTQHVETVQETLRRDEVKIHQPNERRAEPRRSVSAER